MGDMMFRTVRCVECEHDIDFRLSRCPLCGVTLPKSVDVEERAYPPYDGYVRRRRRQQLRQLMAFICGTAIIVTLVINAMYQAYGWWSLTVIAIIAYTWLTVSDTLLSRKSLMLRLGVQVYALAALMVVLDWRAGWYGWSVDYAVPALLILSLVGTLIGLGIARVTGWKTSEIFGFAIAVTVGALVMSGLSFTDVINVAWPSQVVAFFGVVLLAAAAVFLRKDFSQHLREQWHF